MKIKIKEKSFEDVLALPQRHHQKPLKQGLLWRTLLRTVSAPDLIATHFQCRKLGMERLAAKEPALFLMNHSSFIDLEIASKILYPRPFNIVCTTDGFVGKKWLMRHLGCIPTSKFVSDHALVRDMVYATRKLKSSVLMYPEAGYTLDGTTTVLPDSLGACVKLLGVPLVMIRTFGAFTRDPLYNNLQRRRVKVEAEMEYLLSPSEIKERSAEEITALIREQFSFDGFRWQRENGVRVGEPFRADYLHRLLYKCPACHAEGATEGKGTELRCHACGKTYELGEYGELVAREGKTEFSHVPDWFAWERACVREELEKGTYRMDAKVDIHVLCDTKCLYHVGEGRLVHTELGFHLIGCDGKLDYEQSPLHSYSLNSDFNWYEIGDVIGIGTGSMLFYCFPKDKRVSVAKARFAAEELYRIEKAKRDAARAKK